jgi:hypothetical protein
MLFSMTGTSRSVFPRRAEAAAAAASYHAANLTAVAGNSVRALGGSVKVRRYQRRNADRRRGARIEMSASLHVGLFSQKVINENLPK